MANNKLYKTSVMKELQNAINANNCIITPYKDWDFTNSGFRSCGIFMRFLKNESNGKVERYMVLPDDLTHEQYKIWKESPIYKFLYRDLQKDIRDFIGNTPYSIVQYSVNNNKYYVLIRKLIEITSDELSEDDKVEFIKEYCDIMIDSRYYSIIKINLVNDECNSWGFDDKLSLLSFHPTDSEQLDNHITESSEDEYYNDNTTETMEPLF